VLVQAARKGIESLFSTNTQVSPFEELDPQGRVVLGIELAGEGADAAAEYWVTQHSEFALMAALTQFVDTVNQATNGATQLEPDLFRAISELPAAPVAIAIGPRAWLGETPAAGATVKVAVKAPEAGNKVTSTAAALYAGVEAASASGHPDPERLIRLDVADQQELLVPMETAIDDVDAEVQAAFDAYRAAVQSK
jgi:hypothetical protein